MAGRGGRRLPKAAVAALVVVVAAVAVGAGFGIRTVVRALQSHFTSTGCDVGSYTLDPDQASVAAQMIAEVTSFRPALPARANVLVLMAGLQESKLRNLALNEGDRDSVGVLQQRPSQGWGGGKAARLTDVTEATREFLVALRKVAGWQRMAPADAIQAVQISADGGAYAQHEPEATALAAALRGTTAAGISCSFDKPTQVAAPARVVTLLTTQLPVNRPTVSGHAIRVPGARWQTAAWFVANADRLGIDSVEYSARRWTRADGWKAQPTAGRAAVVATMATL